MPRVGDRKQLEGRQLCHCTHLHVYTTHSRAITQWLRAPDPKCTRGQALSVLGRSKPGNFGTAGQLVKTYSYVYTTHSRAITQMLRAPNLKCPRGQALSVLGLSKPGNFGTAKTLVETYSYAYTTHSRAITQCLRAPDPKCTRGQALFCTWPLEDRQLLVLHNDF